MYWIFVWVFFFLFLASRYVFWRKGFFNYASVSAVLWNEYRNLGLAGGLGFRVDMLWVWRLLAVVILWSFGSDNEFLFDFWVCICRFEMKSL